MNRKQFGILIVLLIVLGGAGWYVQQGRNRAANAGEQGTGQKLLGDGFPINDVIHVSIQQGGQEVNLVKKDDAWRVRERDDYPANFSQLSEFLIKLRDLKVVQNEEVGVSQLPRLQLAPAGQGTNSGTVVDLKGKDEKSLAALTLGKKHFRKAEPQAQQFQFGGDGLADGRYVLVNGKTQNALLIADPLNSLEPKPEQWVNKDFFHVERPKAIAVKYPAGDSSYKIERDQDNGDWVLAEPKGDEKLDAARASGVSSPFASPSFNDVLAKSSKLDDLGLGKPIIITVDTFDDLTYTVKVGKKKEQDYPLMVNVTASFPKERVSAADEKSEEKEKADKAWKDRQNQLDDKLKRAQQFENWVYLVPIWNVDPLLKERKELLVEKKDEAKSDEKINAAPVKLEEALKPADALEPAK